MKPPNKNKQLTKTDNLTSYDPPINNNTTTIMNFVNHIKKNISKIRNNHK